MTCDFCASISDKVRVLYRRAMTDVNVKCNVNVVYSG